VSAIRPALALAALLLAASAAHAHTLSESFSNWQVNGDSVRLQFTVPDLESKRLSESGKDLPSTEALGEYIAAHVAVTAGAGSAGGASAGADCARTAGPQPMSSIPGFRRYELTFKCASGDDIHLHSSVLFDKVASHTNFAKIQSGDGELVEQLITQDNQDIPASGEGGESVLAGAGFWKFIQLGLMHIFTGVDHMSFMLGLVLISRRVRDLLFVVTGFTLGHSLTLGLAVTGILRPNAAYIDALVALTIALIGAENIGDSTQRPLPVALGLGGLLFAFAGAKLLGLPVSLPTLLLIGGGLFSLSYLLLTGHMRDAGRVRLVVTLVFGLIHGFGFASNLLEMQLPPGRVAELLVGFNLGVEVGQVTVVLGALAVAWALVKMRLAMPRPLFTDIAAAFLVGEGLYWFLGRSVALG
jgi:hypothetical protein